MTGDGAFCSYFIAGQISPNFFNMSHKIKNIITLILTGVIVLVFVKSISMKLFGNPETISHSVALGLSVQNQKFLGFLEVLSVILFVIPRTGVLGTMLLTAYLGGAIATHIEHGQSPLLAVIVQCLLWITAVLRYPELISRLNKGRFDTV